MLQRGVPRVVPRGLSGNKHDVMLLACVQGCLVTLQTQAAVQCGQLWMTPCSCSHSPSLFDWPCSTYFAASRLEPHSSDCGQYHYQAAVFPCRLPPTSTPTLGSQTLPPPPLHSIICHQRASVLIVTSQHVLFKRCSHCSCCTCSCIPRISADAAAML